MGGYRLQLITWLQPETFFFLMQEACSYSDHGVKYLTSGHLGLKLLPTDLCEAFYGPISKRLCTSDTEVICDFWGVVSYFCAPRCQRSPLFSTPYNNFAFASCAIGMPLTSFKVDGKSIIEPH